MWTKASKLCVSRAFFLKQKTAYDTSSRCPVFLYGQVGGSGVEQRAEAVVKEPLDIRQERVNALVPFTNELWQCFKAEDKRLIEVNPLAKTVDGRWIACDAKV